MTNNAGITLVKSFATQLFASGIYDSDHAGGRQLT